MQRNDFDIVIIGAGMVGSALACALGGSSLRVGLIEAQPLPADWPPQLDQVDGFDPRVSALTLASQQWLHTLQAWPGDCGQRVSPYRFMHVWDAEGTGSISFDAQEVNEPALGHIVENAVTSYALIQRVYQHRNIEVLVPEALQSLAQIEGGSLRLTLASGLQLHTSLVVAADGANSQVRHLAEFKTREWDYGHHAIVTTVECERGHQQTAWQRFLPEGPLAFLPLRTAAGSEQFCSIVWSAVPDHAEYLMGLRDAAFCQELASAFEYRLGKIIACSRRFSFPLRQRHAVNYVQPGLALVGDAAHTIHPLAGQGVNLGLMDAKVLSEELLRAAERQLNPGDESVLKRYQRRRKSDNLTMMASMEGFKRLFEKDDLLIRWARNTGMRWLDQMAPLKRRIIKSAMGL